MRIDIRYPDAQKETFPKLVRFTREPPGMNFISYSRLDKYSMDRQIQEQIEHFSSKDQPFSWYVGNHDLPPNLKEYLVAYGFKRDNPEDDPGALLALDLLDAPSEILTSSSAEIRRIGDRDLLSDVIQIEEQIWGGNFSWIQKRLGDHLAIPGYLSVYVAYIDDAPAAAAWIYFHEDSQFSSLWGGGTIPEHRNKGLYTALLSIRIREAVQRGYQYSIIEASPLSRPLVEKSGFHLLTYMNAYEWNPD